MLKDGSLFGSLQVDRLSVSLVQRLVEALAEGREASAVQPALLARPSTANHTLRYLQLLFAWGIRLGHCKTNPAIGVRGAKSGRMQRCRIRNRSKQCLSSPSHALRYRYTRRER